MHYYSDAACTLELASSTVTSSGIYYLRAENGADCKGSIESVTVSLKMLTSITVQPVAPETVVGTGSSFNLSVTASGDNLTYLWYKDGTPILGNASATTSSLTVTGTTPADYGQYYVVVTGDCGQPQTSNRVTMNILSPDATLKDLMVDGVSIPDFDPQTTEYTYIVPCDVDLVDITGIPNHVNATVVNLSNAGLEIGDNLYAIVVTAENGFTTKTYTVNVVRDCYIPKILKDLEDAIICIGESHTFEILVEGHNLTYEWYYGNNRIIGANTNTYTVDKSELKDYERYYVIIRSNYNGYKASAYSKNVRLWVAEYLPEKLLFSEFPDPAVVGHTYHLKLAGYADVTKYTWNYYKQGHETSRSRLSNPFDNEGVVFSPAVGGPCENEAWATFGASSVGDGMVSGSPSQVSGSNVVSPYSGTVTVTLEHPCGTRELSRSLTVKYPTGTDNITENTITVSPNPTSGLVKVSNTESNQQIRITDVTGSLKGTYRTQEGTTTIDLAGYAKGTYLLQYNGKTFKVIRK